MTYSKHISFISSLNPLDKSGGAELQTYNWMMKFKENNYKISQIIEKTNKNNKDDDVNTFYIKDRTIFNFVSCIQLFIVLIRIKPDICYQRLKNEFSFVIGLYCKIFKKKYVWWCSSDASAKKNSYYIHAIERKYLKNNFKHFIARIDAKIVSYISDYGTLLADVTICQNNYQKELLLKRKYKNVNLIKNSVNLSVFPKVPKKAIQVIFVGNLRPVKQPEIFLDLVDSLKNTEIKFIMIGKSYDNKSLLNRIQNMSNLIYYDQIGHDEVLNHIASSKILVNTSIHEGFSNVFIESWILGAKVLSLNSNPDKLLQAPLGSKSKNISDMKRYILNNIYLDKSQEIEEIINFAVVNFDLDINYNSLRQSVGIFND